MRGGAPHYLALSHSLVYDFDFDLSNQYAPDSSYSFADSPAPADELVAAARGGGSYLTDGVGLSLAMAGPYLLVDTIASALPASALERLRWDRARAVRDLLSFLMALLYGWVAVLTLRLAVALGGEPRVALWSVVLAFVTPPMLGLAFLVSSAVPAAALVLSFTLAQVRSDERPWRSAIPLACLPWLRASLSLVVVAGAVWVALRERRRSPAWVSGALEVVAPVVVSLALLTLVQVSLFGGGWLPSLYGGGHGWTAAGFGAIPALALDPDAGLLRVAPFWLVAIAGIASLEQQPAYRAFVGVALAATWFLAGPAGAASMVTGGAPPGLLLVPLLPLVVPFLAAGWRVVRRGRVRWLAYGTIAWSLTMTWYLVDRPSVLWNEPGRGLGRSFDGALRGFDAEGRARIRLAQASHAVALETLTTAVEANALAQVRLCLEAGIDPRPALVTAARLGAHEALALMTSASQARGFGAHGARALAWADADGSRILEAAGADVDARNPFDETALIVAAAAGLVREVDRLLQLGAVVDAVTRTRRTALMAAVTSGRTPIVRALIGAGADVHAVDADGWTPLLLAVRHGTPAMTSVLLDAGADPDVVSRQGWTPLMWAARDGQVPLIQRLVAAGADVDRASAAGATPLVQAARQGHIRAVARLLSAGADPSLTVDGVSPQDAARYEGHTAIAARLAARGERPASRRIR